MTTIPPKLERGLDYVVKEREGDELPSILAPRHTGNAITVHGPIRLSVYIRYDSRHRLTGLDTAQLWTHTWKTKIKVINILI